MADNFYEQVLARLTSLSSSLTLPPKVAVTAGFNQPGQSAIFRLEGRTKVSIGIVLINVNTSVTLGLRCGLREADQPFPLSADGGSTVTLTANGSYLYTWEGAAEAIAVSFESEAGGTDAQYTLMLRAQ